MREPRACARSSAVALVCGHGITGWSSRSGTSPAGSWVSRHRSW